MRIRQLFVMASLVAAACNDGGDGNGSPDLRTASPDLAGGGEATCTPDSTPVALAARYAIQGKLNVHLRVPADCSDACLLDGDAAAELLLLAEVTQTGTQVTVSARPCRIELPPVSLSGAEEPIELTVPDELLESVPMVTADATLAGTTTCAGLTSESLSLVVGARLADPIADRLPTFNSSAQPPVRLCGASAGTRCADATDSGCICDQEGDAKAGATVEVQGEIPVVTDVDRVYLALRSVFTLDGKVFPEQRLRGRVANLVLDQSPVGCRRASGDCDAATTNAVATLNPRVTQSTNTQSTFVGVPVAAGFTCAQVVAQAGTLFQ